MREVWHAFDAGERLFDPLSITFHAGSTYAITGASGSGKSTLLEIASGWRQPSSGTVRRPEGFTKQWVFQSPIGVAQRSALDHVVLPILLRGGRRLDAENEARRLLTLFGIESLGRRSFGDLSGGEAQRLMFARAVAARPDLLLLDEPTSQLDLIAKQAVNQAIARTARDNTVVMVATHDPATRDACDHIIELRRSNAAT